MKRRPYRVPERVVQQHGVRLLRQLAAQVYVLGTTRRSGDYQGTMQTPGIPDVVFFLQRGDRSAMAWWEVKAAGGRLRPEQIVFRDACVSSGVQHITGDLDALIAWLIEFGALAAENVAHYRRPLKPWGGQYGQA